MKTPTKFLRVIAIIVLSISATSCLNNVEEQTGTLEPVVTPGPNPTPGPINPTPTTISFKDNVKPIIDNNCVRCHNGSQFPDLRSYRGIRANASAISSNVASRSMPIGGRLTQQQINSIVSWVNQGAQNN